MSPKKKRTTPCTIGTNEIRKMDFNFSRMKLGMNQNGYGIPMADAKCIIHAAKTLKLLQYNKNDIGKEFKLTDWLDFYVFSDFVSSRVDHTLIEGLDASSLM
jgi:hypothetical protein